MSPKVLLLSNLRRHNKTHLRADAKSRSSSTNKASSKIPPLLSAADSSQSGISYTDGSDDDRGRQIQWFSNQGPLFKHDTPYFLQASSSSSSSLPYTPMENSTMDQNVGEPYGVFDSYSILPETCFLFDWLDPAPTILRPDNASYTFRTPHHQFSTFSVPHSSDQPRLDWDQHASSHQQELDCNKHFDIQQTQQLYHLQRQDRLQQDFQFISPHGFYLDHPPHPPSSILQ